MPPKIISKILTFKKDPTKLTIDTVKGFYQIVKNLNLRFN